MASNNDGFAKETVLPHGDQDIWIGVMGVTGAGKSSFIQQCVPTAKNIVGENYDSFTRDCKSYQMSFEGRNIFLIDTPGFNDSSVRDVDILNDLAAWLAKAYKDEICLNGLIYLHGIQDARFKGSDKVHLDVFKKLTGLNNMTHVVLSTSFWDTTPFSNGEHRENQLVTRHDFWKVMKDSGAEVIRFKNDRASAESMVKHILDVNKKTVLEIQREMGTGKTVRETGAGQTLEEDISDRVKDAEKEFEKKNADLETALREENSEAIKEAVDAQDKIKAQLVEFQETRDKLDVTTKQLIEQKDAEIARVKQEAENLKLEREKTGEQHKQQLHEKEAQLEQNNRDWEQSMQVFADKLDGFVTGLNANSTAEQSSSQGQNPRLMEEKVEEMFQRRERENKIKELEAKLAEAQAPPPYSLPASQYQQPAPQAVYYPQQSQNNDAAFGAAGVGLGLASMAAAGCTVM